MSPQAPAGTSEAPLAGLRIVEFGMFVAVPSGGMTLAGLGADVIRIDPIGGASDTTRAPLHPSGQSIYWASMNRAKRSIMVDLRSEEGSEIATALVTAPGDDAGVFLTNAVGSGWHSDAALRARRPDLISVRLLGTSDGRPALDYTVNWEVGFAAVTGPGGSTAPTMHVLPAWDLLAGAQIALNVLAAERRRSRGGGGAEIVLSLEDVALWSTDALGILAELQTTGDERGRTGDFVYGTFGTAFATAGGPPVMVVALTRRQWQDLIEVTGVGDRVARWEADHATDLSDEHERWRFRAELKEILSPWFRSRSTEVVLDALSGTRLVASALGTFRGVLAERVPGHPRFRTVRHPLLGEHAAMGNPARFADGPMVPEPVAPLLGADTEAILADVLGLETARIGDLIDRGVVAASGAR